MFIVSTIGASHDARMMPWYWLQAKRKSIINNVAKGDDLWRSNAGGCLSFNMDSRKTDC